jgi:hypothetical protein
MFRRLPELVANPFPHGLDIDESHFPVLSVGLSRPHPQEYCLRESLPVKEGARAVILRRNNR